MNFLSPSAFYFLLAIPVVVLFYLLKRKRVVRLVGSTLLWQKFLAETQANAPFQKLKHNWLLLLQILLLLLAILALARPYFSAKTVGGRLLVVILDSSASMQSTDEPPTRFDKARSEALKLVDGMHDTDEMVVLLSGGNTEVKQSATREKSVLRQVILATKASDSPTHLNEGLKLAETLIKNRDKPEVHLFSDGATGTLTDFENKGLPLVFHQIGQRGFNLGIVNLEVRPNPENAAQRAIFATVANNSTNQQQVDLELRFGEKLLEVKPVTLAARQSSPQVFIASQETDGVFNVRINAKDDLAVDNTASIISLLPQPAKVLLVTGGNRFLEKALKAVPNVQLSVAATLSDDAPQFDLVVLDNVAPLVWPRGNILAFHVVNTNWFEVAGRVEGPPIVDWKATHPLLRFASFDNVQIGETIAIKTPNWGMPLVDSPQTPLMIAGELGRQRLAWVGFDALASTWPLRISFPIFVANAVDWLNPASAQAAQLSVRAGAPFRIALPNTNTVAEITMPDGQLRKREIDVRRGELVFGETQRQGVYHVKAGTNQFAFSVNLLDASESETTPRTELQFGKYAKASATTYRQANLELWRWIAAAGIGMLLFEWWFYHRRTA